MALTTRRPSRRLNLWAAVAAVGMTFCLAGCSDEAGSPTPDAATPVRSSTEAPAQGMQVVELAILGDTTETIDEPVEVKAGETFAFEGGTSAFVMSIDQPGLVHVEAKVDDSGGAIVQLEVAGRVRRW